MFYSHEVLTSRKHGVATVWLVATLGSRSNTKKVSKKAIINVDVKNVCKTIMEPEAPLALRLQGNLLYGVSRVNGQQWDYLLTDAQAAQNLMRAMVRTVQSEQRDLNAGRIRSDQLVIADDPAFAVHSALPALDLDILDLNNAHNGDSQRTSQSMLSMRSRSGSASSMHSPSTPDIHILSSSNGGGVYQLPDNPFGGSSAQKPFNGALNNDEEMLLMDDNFFDYDADGNMHDILPDERVTSGVGNLVPGNNPNRDDLASERVRKEHEHGRALQIVDMDGDFNMNLGNDDYDLPLLPDAEPLPMMSGALGIGDRPLHLNDEDRVLSAPEATSSDAAEAQQKRKGKRPAKKIKVMNIDQSTMFKNGDLIAWNKGYLDHMDAKILTQQHQKVVKNSKKTALQFVYGAGLNGVGRGIGLERLSHPLAMFSGAALLEKIVGDSVPAPGAVERGTKRKGISSANEQSPPKRPALEDEVGRGFNDDKFMQFNDDHDPSMEAGRDAPSALPDYPSSAMPWNKSASLHSHRQNLSSRPGSLAGRRLTPASPLGGRGSALPNDLIGEEDEMIMYGRSDSVVPEQQEFGYGGETGAVSSSQNGVGGSGSQDLELFGAAAAVDTQTAGDPQWVRTVLDRESNNFFEYVKNTINEEFGIEDDVDVDELSQDFSLNSVSRSRTKNESKGKGKEVERSVSFEGLFNPDSNSHVVAAQAFYHVLTLATKGKVWVRQDNGEGQADFEPFGKIWIGVQVV